MKRGRQGLTLLEFVIDLIIAAIVLIILFYLASVFLGIWFNQTKLDQAQGELDEVYNNIAELGLEKTVIITLTVPKDWHLLSLDKEGTRRKELNIGKLPPVCDAQDCLCICRKIKQKGI